MKKKVLIAMSGGVDSSVSAFLLKENGYEVAGVTMCLGVKPFKYKKPRCCGPLAIEDARRVCDRLKVPHYVMDFSRELEEYVIKNFIRAYLNGRTPNPCIECNKSIKFGLLLERARTLGFDYLATGHYAKIENENEIYFLKRAKDRKKDQTYFLYPIRCDNLRYIIFPLGDLTKEEVRRLAQRLNLPIADKPQSQDICFIPDGNYRKFLLERIKEVKPGPILDLEGNILGKHKGIFFYTIGQREGLGISKKGPLYVIKIDPANNRIFVGSKEDLKARGLLATDINYLCADFGNEVVALVRYTHKEASCKIEKFNGKLKVLFKEPQEAITPGQSVVLYRNDLVLAGGIIEEVIS